MISPKCILKFMKYLAHSIARPTGNISKIFIKNYDMVDEGHKANIYLSERLSGLNFGDHGCQANF